MHNHSCLEFSFLYFQDQVYILIIRFFKVYSGSRFLDGHMLIEYLLGLTLQTWTYQSIIHQTGLGRAVLFSFHRLPFCLVCFLCVRVCVLCCVCSSFFLLVFFFNTKILSSLHIWEKQRPTMVARVHSGLIDLIPDYFYLTWFAFSPSNLQEGWVFLYRNDISKDYSTHVACDSAEFGFSIPLTVYGRGFIFLSPWGPFPCHTVASDPSVPL